MNFDAGIGAVDGGRAQVLQRGRGGADESDFALERAGLDPVLDHVGERNVLESSFTAAVWNQRARGFVDRNGERAHLEPFEPVIALEINRLDVGEFSRLQR